MNHPSAEEATPASYRKHAADVGLVHLACHGSVGNVAGDAALLLAPDGDGTARLTADDIAAVRLRSTLAFLSSCRSGTGRPTADGTIGLARAFLAAGADAVVGSLWNVPDESTRRVSEHFYDAWLSGVDAAEALRRAMVTTRDDVAAAAQVPPHMVHPAEWGAFFRTGVGLAGPPDAGLTKRRTGRVERERRECRLPRRPLCGDRYFSTRGRRSARHAYRHV